MIGQTASLGAHPQTTTNDDGSILDARTKVPHHHQIHQRQRFKLRCPHQLTHTRKNDA